MKSKWPDFLFTVAVRFVSGAVVGVLVSLPVIFFAGSRGRGRQKSLLVELTQAGNHRLIIGWFVVSVFAHIIFQSFLSRSRNRLAAFYLLVFVVFLLVDRWV